MPFYAPSLQDIGSNNTAVTKQVIFHGGQALRVNVFTACMIWTVKVKTSLKFIFYGAWKWSAKAENRKRLNFFMLFSVLFVYRENVFCYPNIK